LSAYRDALIEGARRIGLTVSEELADAMTLHHDLVVKWAAKTNLTTVTDPVESASLHGVDSLLFLEHLPERSGARVVDVGSGAGFPGVVVALGRPDLSITLLEPKRKKVSFLNVVLAELGRNDVKVVEARLEDAKIFPTDVVISRATIPPLDLIQRSGPLLASGGRLIVTAGAGAPPLEEIKKAGENAGLVHVRRTESKLPTGETRIFDVLDRPHSGS
jgi:16S rRNA (guanine527-N7)-methyltransferase